MAHSRNWNSGIPIDHTKFKAIPEAISALALDIEERLQAFFYGFTSGETSDGIKYLPFWVQTTAPTGAANKICMYAQDSNSKAALKLKSEDDVEIQLTERDWGLLDDFALSNNTNLRARNAADDGFVDLIKADGSNIPTIPDGARLASTAAPTQDYEIPNKKYPDDILAAALNIASGHDHDGADSKKVITSNLETSGASVFDTNGYIKLGNFIIQWGLASVAADTEAVTFPIEFPTACLSCVACAGGSSPGTSNVAVYSVTKTGFTVHHDVAERPARWIAIGY